MSTITPVTGLESGPEWQGSEGGLIGLNQEGLVSFCFVLLDLSSKWIVVAFSLEKDKMARNTKPHEVAQIMTHT